MVITAELLSHMSLPTLHYNEDCPEIIRNIFSAVFGVSVGTVLSYIICELHRYFFRDQSMFIDDKVSYFAVNEAYCLLSAYLREEKIAANYNSEEIQEAVEFLAEILKHPENFKSVDRKSKKVEPEVVEEEE